MSRLSTMLRRQRASILNLQRPTLELGGCSSALCCKCHVDDFSVGGTCSHAYFSLGRYEEAAKAYEKAVELDPSNASLKSSLSTARSRASESSDGSRDVGASSPPPAGGANPFAGLAGLAGLGGAGGGMPDIASLMQNPQLMQMAQQMMSVSCCNIPKSALRRKMLMGLCRQNGGMERMMQNPMMRQMVSQV